MSHIAVIGAGLAGLVCADDLRRAGLQPTIFEKSRGIGGRMATRRCDFAAFDHGAQYFTVRDERFRRQVNQWRADGICAPWDARIVAIENGRITDSKDKTQRFVGVPAMNSPAKALAERLPVQTEVRISEVRSAAQGWTLQDDRGAEHGPFAAVVTTAPPPQSAELLRGCEQLAAQIRGVEMKACWAAMVAFGCRVDVSLDAAFVNSGPLSWIARNSSKPGRDASFDAWVIHAGHDWTEARLEASPEEVGSRLLDELLSTLGVEHVPTVFLAAHRWRYALPPEPLHEGVLADDRLRVCAAGDWLSGSRVEGAYLSGLAAAERVRAWLD